MKKKIKKTRSLARDNMKIKIKLKKTRSPAQNKYKNKIHSRNCSKKAQIGSTLTWFVGFLVIFFVMFLFLAATIALAAVKGIKVSKEPVKYDSSISETQRVLIVYLKSSVETEKETEEMRDLILSSLNVYIEAGVDLDRRPDYLDPELLKIAEAKDNLVLKNSHDILSKVCEDYMLKIPQGIIIKGKENFISESEAETFVGTETLVARWTRWAEIEIPYKNQFIEIKYRQLRSC